MPLAEWREILLVLRFIRTLTANACTSSSDITTSNQTTDGSPSSPRPRRLWWFFVHYGAILYTLTIPHGPGALDTWGRGLIVGMLFLHCDPEFQVQNSPCNVGSLRQLEVIIIRSMLECTSRRYWQLATSFGAVFLYVEFHGGNFERNGKYIIGLLAAG